MRARSFSSGFILAFALASAPALSFAQDDATTAEAKKQFVAGTKAFSSGKFAEAATAFEAAAALKPNAVALYTAALAWEQASQSERAADDYGRAVELPAGSLTAQQESTAKERLASLEKVLGTLAVIGPDGTKVQLDQFTETVVPVRLHGTGGTHSLNVKLAGKPGEKREVLLEGGQMQKLDLAPTPTVVKHVDDTTPPPQPKEVVVEKPVSHFSALKAIGFTAIGVGGASALAALILGLSAQDAGDAYNRAPNHDAYVHANALADWCNGAWITAGLLVAVGVTLVLIPEKSGGDAAAPPPEKKPEKTDDNARLQIVPSMGGFVLKGVF
jgi:tetratricopeptide (TPR) repeat protein